MGITVQFRGFGTYPRPQLAQLPEEHPRANRSGNWQAAQRRAEKSKVAGKRRPKTPPIRHANVRSGPPVQGDDGAGPAVREPLGLSLFGSFGDGSSAASSARSRQGSGSYSGSAFRPTGSSFGRGDSGGGSGGMSSSGGVRRAGKQHQQRKRGRVLDGFFILRATGVDYPNELSTARLQHCALTETNTAQLAEFGNLAHLDVSGNALRFEDLQSLPRLEVLEMALNGVVTLGVGAGFLSLTILDLSYNNVAPEAILSLGSLPALKSLDLSNNGLNELPLSMAAATSDTADSSFAVLETLNLDDNRLKSPGVFQALAGLPRLQVLDLNRNRVSFVPQLVPSIPDGIEVALDPNAIKPFAALQVLGMTENRIAHAEDVLTVASWDGIEALHLWGNPIVTQKSELPPELSEELRRRRNRGQPMLQVPRANVTTKIEKPTLAESVPPQDVVTVAPLVLPQIVRGGALREYEADKAQRLYLEYTTSRPASTAGPLPPITPTAPAEATVGEEDEDEDEDEDDGPGFFLTEMAGAGEAMPPPPHPLEAATGAGRGGELVAYDMPVLAPGEHFEVSADELREAQRLGIMTPSATTVSAGGGRGARSTGLESLGATTPAPGAARLPGLDGGDGGDGGDDGAELLADEGMAIVPFVANLPKGVKEEYKELFRDDTEEEAALGPLKYVPQSIKASTQALRFALQHPLTLVFDRKPPKPEAQLALTAEGETREWSTQNLQEALNSLL